MLSSVQRQSLVLLRICRPKQYSLPIRRTLQLSPDSSLAFKSKKYFSVGRCLHSVEWGVRSKVTGVGSAIFMCVGAVVVGWKMKTELSNWNDFLVVRGESGPGKPNDNTKIEDAYCEMGDTAFGSSEIRPGIPIPVTSMNKASRDLPGEVNNHGATLMLAEKADVVTPSVPGHVPYLLVGAGTASFAAYRVIKSKDPRAKILIVGEENRNPYMHPPLSKELWLPPFSLSSGEENSVQDDDSDEYPIDNAELNFRQWSGRERSLYFEQEEFYTPVKDLLDRPNGGISVLKGRRVVRIDPSAQKAFLDDGHEISYDKCLLATGGRPKSLDIFDLSELRNKVTLFRTADDFFKLRDIVKNSSSVAVLGGGFLGSELACALATTRSRTPLKVTQVFPERGNMARVLPDYLSRWTTEKVREEGVNVFTETKVQSVRLNETVQGGPRQVELSLKDGHKVLVDHVVVAVGLEPNTQLASPSGLEVDERLGGFKANAELEVRTNLWAAGDVASYYDVNLGRRRLEHHDNAVVTGRLAGENMTGGRKVCTHQSMFWSDLGPNVGFEAIGVVDSSLPTVGVFTKSAIVERDTPEGISKHSLQTGSESDKQEKNPAANAAVTKAYDKGVVFYLRDDNVVVGILMWNIFNRLSVARKVIREHRQYDDLSEVAKLFNLYEKYDEDASPSST